MYISNKSEIKSGLKILRALASETNAMIDAGDLSRAYNAAERAQHTAFDIKAMIERSRKVYNASSR